MKALIIKSVLILFISTGFSNPNTSINTIEKTIIAQFEGIDESGYMFSYDSDDGGLDFLFFETISEDILKVYNFDEEDFFEQSFEIKLTIKIIDEDLGIESYTLNSIRLIE